MVSAFLLLQPGSHMVHQTEEMPWATEETWAARVRKRDAAVRQVISNIAITSSSWMQVAGDVFFNGAAGGCQVAGCEVVGHCRLPSCGLRESSIQTWRHELARVSDLVYPVVVLL